METTVTLTISGTTRESIRTEVVQAFLSEVPGTGTGNLASYYKYIVETLQDGTEVYLWRPAILNKGFDFEIHVSGGKFGTRTETMPSHGCIFEDLETKQAENPEEFDKLKAIVLRLYNCENVSVAEFNKLRFKTGYKVEVTLLVIKWLFIEQDVTYWNWSGRNKFFSGIEAHCGAIMPVAPQPQIHVTQQAQI